MVSSSGRASAGVAATPVIPKEFPPDETHLLDWLDAQHVPIFFKGNLRSLPWAAAHWRANFPPQTAILAYE